MAQVADDARVELVIPTAINVVLMVNDNIVQNLRRAESADIVLPSLYKRAFLVVGETDEVAIVRKAVSDGG